MSKEKKSKKKEADKALRFRVSAVRDVMAVTLRRNYSIAKNHLPGLSEHEFIAGLSMGLVDASCSILGLDKNMPKNWTIDIIIDLLKTLKDIPNDE